MDDFTKAGAILAFFSTLGFFLQLRAHKKLRKREKGDGV